jgi:hypothetical protein
MGFGIKRHHHFAGLIDYLDERGDRAAIGLWGAQARRAFVLSRTAAMGTTVLHQRSLGNAPPLPISDN